MLDFELEELKRNSDWRLVLSAYHEAHASAPAEAKSSEADFDGWMPRIMAVDGLDEEDLPKIHGKLIAWGFLKFQLASRGTGVVYQISPAGRAALSEIENDDDNLSDESQDEELERVSASEDAA